MVCEMAAAKALAITGVSDVNKFATLAVTASALTASPAPAGNRALGGFAGGDSGGRYGLLAFGRPGLARQHQTRVDRVIDRGGVLRAAVGDLRLLQRDRFPGALPRQRFAPVVQLFIEEQLHVFRAAQQARLMRNARGKIGIGSA